MTGIYKEDILGNSFEQQTIMLKNDYEGEAVATLIRRLSSLNTQKAVLYIHGFNDYFFQKEMALAFNEKGYHFYALDLRKYGRSFLPHQKFNDIRNLKAYYEEIQRSLEIIHEERNLKVYLIGHSTGGLILTLFAKDHPGSLLFDGLILNSPFYEFNQSKWVKFLLPFASFTGRFFPRITISGGFSEEYGKSIHKKYLGEWEYDLEWKPNIAPKVNLGWVRSIYKGQKELRKPFFIRKPVLILHSEVSATDLSDKEQIQSSDVILQVEDIKCIAKNIQGNTRIVAVKGGLHDLILSQKPVREKVYTLIFNWLKSL